jgi:predicted DNA-binding protein
VVGLVRKAVVKVVLSKEQRELLTALAARLGTSESEALRLALMDYVKEVSLMSEALHRKKKVTN